VNALPRHTRALLAAYPPSFKERYGPEQRGLLEDAGSAGSSWDLSIGVVRAWLRPTFGQRGSTWQRNRLLATASTVWVMWIAAFFGGLTYSRLVNDPPVPALKTGWGATLNRIATSAYLVGVVSTALIVGAVFCYIVFRAWRTKTWQPITIVLPFALLVVWQLATWGILSHVRWSTPVTRHSHVGVNGVVLPAWFVVLILLWVLMLIPIMMAGAVLPIRALRASAIPIAVIRVATLAAVIPVTCLSLTGFATVAFVVGEAATNEVGLFLNAVAAGGLAVVAIVAATSYLRAVPALRTASGASLD